MPPAAVGDGSCCTTGRGRTWACCGSTWAATGGWWICTPTGRDLHGGATGQGKRPGAAGGGPLDAVRPRAQRTGNRLDRGVLAASQGESGTKLRHRSGPAGKAPAAGQGEDPAGCQQVSGSGVLAGVERALRTTARGRGGHASSADAADRFGECAEPCRATPGQQRLHVLVRGPEISDRPDGRESGDAGKEPANRTTSEWRPQGAVRRSVCGSERVRSQSASGQATGEVGSQGSQSGRQERLDGRLLRASGPGAMGSDTDGQRARLSWITAARGQQGTPGKSGPAVFAFLYPKPPLGSLTKAIGLGSSMPSWRSGKTHGFCVTGGHSPIASEPTPSRRLWAAAPGATPALRIEHITGGRSGPLKTGTFYFAGKRNFLLCLDTINCPPAPCESHWRWTGSGAAGTPCAASPTPAGAPGDGPPRGRVPGSGSARAKK